MEVKVGWHPAELTAAKNGLRDGYRQANGELADMDCSRARCRLTSTTTSAIGYVVRNIEVPGISTSAAWAKSLPRAHSNLLRRIADSSCMNGHGTVGRILDSQALVGPAKLRPKPSMSTSPRISPDITSLLPPSGQLTSAPANSFFGTKLLTASRQSALKICYLAGFLLVQRTAESAKQKRGTIAPPKTICYTT
jgi:hypothetical protein